MYNYELCNYTWASHGHLSNFSSFHQRAVSLTAALSSVSLSPEHWVLWSAILLKLFFPPNSIFLSWCLFNSLLLTLSGCCKLHWLLPLPWATSRNWDLWSFRKFYSANVSVRCNESILQPQHCSLRSWLHDCVTDMPGLLGEHIWCICFFFVHTDHLVTTLYLPTHWSYLFLFNVWMHSHYNNCNY